MNKIKIIVVSIATLFLVGGCTAEEQQMTLQMIGTLGAANGAGGATPTANAPSANNANYQQGLRDGCLTKQTGKVTKSQNGYAYDLNYKNGWNKGYAQCKSDHFSPATQQNAQTVAQPVTPTEYAKGQQEGCYSAQYGQTKRDNYLYNYNKSYQNGWDSGYQKCKR